ncbi:MAG: hypothetical protein KAJ88_01670, partial [Candidatus Aenigmarchaeota archaeon]|nr:hypothetical protein [Candidatus Aenigmarchaeota archaeon]
MNKNIHFRHFASFAFIILFLLVFASVAFSEHTHQSINLYISSPSVAYWTMSGSENIYNFAMLTDESINKTTITVPFPLSYTINESTINSSGYPDWTCTNTSDTITCSSPEANATNMISVSFSAKSPTITDETIYSWQIDTTDLNGSVNTTTLTTGVDGQAPQIETQGTTDTADINATSSSYAYLTVNVSDANINTVKINLSSLGDSYSNETAMTKNNTIYYYNITGNPLLISGVKTLELNLTDKFGHYNDTESITLTVYDITKPTVTFTANQSSVDASGEDEIIFYAEVTDTE